MIDSHPAGSDPAPIGSEARRIVRVTISGQVQGVGYRAWIQGEAWARGVRGWVRNRSCGDVEALFAGPADVVETLCELCRRGPPLAEVEKVEVVETGASALADESVGAGFRQIATI